MRKSLMLLCALVMCAGSASADHIGVFRDPTGYSCTLQNPPVATPFPLYVVHKFNTGSTASHFKVSDESTLFSTSQSTIAGISVGTWNTDWSIAYGACLLGDVHIATLNFLYFGTPLLCTHRMGITPAPLSASPGSITTLNCAQEIEVATGGRIWFGSGAHKGEHGDCYCGTLPTQEATWGAVKALYR